LPWNHRLRKSGAQIEEAQARAFLTDIEALNKAGTFSASFIVQAATGVKP
jgi:hypothetical protein